MATPTARFITDPVRIPEEALSDSARIQLIFHEVNHAVPGFEGRVFFNNPDADEFTPLTPESGYVGSFDVLEDDAVIDKKLTITDAISRLSESDAVEFPITVIAVTPQGIRAEVLEFKGMSFQVNDDMPA